MHTHIHTYFSFPLLFYCKTQDYSILSTQLKALQGKLPGLLQERKQLKEKAEGLRKIIGDDQVSAMSAMLSMNVFEEGRGSEENHR